MTSQKLYDFLQKFNSLDVRVIRYNLQQACSKLYDTYNGRNGMMKMLDGGISVSTFNAMLNSSCESKIDLEKFIQIIGKFNLNLDEILTDNNFFEKEDDNKKWTDDAKKEFIKYYEQHKTKKTASYYNLNANSVETYYKKYNKK